MVSAQRPPLFWTVVIEGEMLLFAIVEDLNQGACLTIAALLNDWHHAPRSAVIQTATVPIGSLIVRLYARVGHPSAVAWAA